MKPPLIPEKEPALAVHRILEELGGAVRHCFALSVQGREIPIVYRQYIIEDAPPILTIEHEGVTEIWAPVGSVVEGDEESLRQTTDALRDITDGESKYEPGEGANIQEVKPHGEETDHSA